MRGVGSESARVDTGNCGAGGIGTLPDGLLGGLRPRRQEDHCYHRSPSVRGLHLCTRRALTRDFLGRERCSVSRFYNTKRRHIVGFEPQLLRLVTSHQCAQQLQPGDARHFPRHSTGSGR